MRADKVSFLHFRHFRHDKIQPTGGLTIAYRLINFDDVAGVVEIEYNFSECGDKEHYKRRVGAAIASGRLDSPKCDIYRDRLPKEDWFNIFEGNVINSYYMSDGCKLVNTSRAKGK
jgi:hypothetical protein